MDHWKVIENELTEGFRVSLPLDRIRAILSNVRAQYGQQLEEARSEDSVSDGAIQCLVDIALNEVLVESLKEGDAQAADAQGAKALAEAHSYASILMKGNKKTCSGMTANTARTTTPKLHSESSLAKEPSDAVTAVATSQPISRPKKCDCKYSNLTTVSASNPLATLSLLTDEAQLSAFQTVKDLLSSDLEDWYILDTLMTYNFNVSDAINVIFEEMGVARVSYKHAVELSVSTSRRTVSLTAKLGQDIQSSLYASSYRAPEPAASSVSDSILLQRRLVPFGWTRSYDAALEAKAVVCRENPNANIEIDEFSGQLVFKGLTSIHGSAASKRTLKRCITLDLHHCTVKMALEICQSAILYAISEMDRHRHMWSLHFIFGRGLHSTRRDRKCPQVSVLQMAICNFFNRRAVNYVSGDEHNASVVVNL